MIKAQKILKPEWYTPASEKEAAVPTRFNLQPMDGVQSLAVSIYRDPVHRNVSMTSESARAALLAGLTGWENFIDENNKPVDFLAYDKEANLKRLSWDLVLELALEIYVRSHISEAERKNSSSLPTSRPSSESPSTAAPASGGDTVTNQIQPDSSNG